MPIHDWTRITAGGFHTFHQDWTIEITRTLNRGLLPAGYAAFTDLRVPHHAAENETFPWHMSAAAMPCASHSVRLSQASPPPTSTECVEFGRVEKNGWEPDVVAIQSSGLPRSGGKTIAERPPQAQHVASAEIEAAAYARKANRIVVRHEFGNAVALIEVVSPGNKDSAHAIRSFVAKAVDFLQVGVHFFVIDLFPPTARDPHGIPQLIWGEVTDAPLPPRPSDKPLSVASFDAGNPFTGYLDYLAVGDSLPDAPLFLAPGWYIDVPLETTYAISWALVPQPIRDRVADSPE